MTLAEYSLTAFAVLNGGRTVAYFPQLVRVYRCPHGAAAVSLWTWGLFAAANVATVSYALTVANDHVVAIVFALNAIGCLAIFGATALKRISDGSRTPAFRHWLASIQQSGILLARRHSASSRCDASDSPSAPHRDRMILDGLMS